MNVTIHPKSLLMKNLLLIAILACFIISTNAQISVGPPGAIKPTDFKKKDLEEMRSSTTCFVIREIDKEQLATIEKILKEVWTFNKYEIIDFDQYLTLAKKPGKLFFGLRSYNRSSEYVKSADLYGKYTQSTEMYIQLWKNGTEAKPNNIDETVMAVMSVPTAYGLYNALKEIQTLDAFSLLCKSDVVIPEWNWGFLKNNLQVINNCLVENKPRWNFASDVDKKEIGNLVSQKLYVNENSIKSVDKRESGKPFDKYPYKTEIISSQDLGKKIVESATPFYYFMVYYDGTDKIVAVRNSATGSFVYSKYKGLAYFIKAKDIEALADEIK